MWSVSCLYKMIKIVKCYIKCLYKYFDTTIVYTSRTSRKMYILIQNCSTQNVKSLNNTCRPSYSKHILMYLRFSVVRLKAFLYCTAFLCSRSTNWKISYACCVVVWLSNAWNWISDWIQNRYLLLNIYLHMTH